MRKQLWTISGLAVELDRDRRTIADALSNVRADGEKAGRSAWFMTSAIRALSSDPEGDGLLDPAQERARKDRAFAISAEIKNDIATGQVVLAEVAIASQVILCRKIKNKIEALPTRVATRGIACKTVAELHALVSREAELVLLELSNDEGLLTLDGVKAEAVLKDAA
jgi:hypothetical protein